MMHRYKLYDLVRPYFYSRKGWYHSMNHVDQLLEDAQLYGLSENGDIFQAILFHDIIYFIPPPGRKLPTSNERLSAAAYNAIIPDRYYRANVEHLIRATEHHIDPTFIVSDPIINSFLDLDLLGLAASESTFDHYQDQIDHELLVGGWTEQQAFSARLKWFTDARDQKLIHFRALPDRRDLAFRAYQNIDRAIANYQDKLLEKYY